MLGLDCPGRREAQSVVSSAQVYLTVRRHDLTGWGDDLAS